MDHNASATLDSAMIKLFAAGAAHRIGLPIWLAKHVLTREDFPHSANSILGVQEMEKVDYPPINLAEDFDEMVGYQFSWGSVSESYLRSKDKDPGEDEDTVFFQILPEQLLMAHPEPAFWEDWMIEMCDAHPQASEEFDADEAMGSFHTLLFSATGADEIARLRKFMAKTFLPRILPDMLTDAQKMLEATATDPIARYRRS